MYSEVSLGGDWFPARFEEIDKKYVRATIIDSTKARDQNIIGIDLNLPKERVILVEEPLHKKRLENWNAYGVSFWSKKKHTRHVSAVPNSDTALPIEPLELFPGISEDQIDILDFCLRKYLHRFGKLDATWNEVQRDLDCDIKAYTQNVGNNDKRIMVRAIIDAPKYIVARVLGERTAGLDIADQDAYELEVLKEYGNCMKIIRRITIPEKNRSLTASREAIAYDWKFSCDGTSYNLRVSLEADDPTDLGKLEPDSPYIRQTVHPGSGFTYTSKSKYQTELVMMLHMDPGGWLPIGPLIKQTVKGMMKQVKAVTVEAIVEFDDDRSSEEEYDEST